MTQDQATPNGGELKTPHQQALAKSHYALLGLHPSASVREIRQTYRDLSKLYHPDTTNLPTAIATTKFQQLNEAYATLTSPERRSAYDRKIGYSSVPVIQPLPNLNHSSTQNRASPSSSAYLDPTDRPLSPGEVFALFILGITFIGCLFLAIAVGVTRGESLLPPTAAQNTTVQQLIRPKSTSTNEVATQREPRPASHSPMLEEPNSSTSEFASQPAAINLPQPIRNPPETLSVTTKVKVEQPETESNRSIDIENDS